MKIGRVLFIAILLFSGSMILASTALMQKMANDSIASMNIGNFLKDLTLQQDLKDKYQQEVIKDLNDFVAGSLSKKDLAGKLFALYVPKDYQTLHFSLVTAFDDLSTNQRTQETKNRLDDLRQTYAWLSTAISLIISNNF